MIWKFGATFLITAIFATSSTYAAQCLVNGKWHPYASSMCRNGTQGGDHSSRRNKIKRHSANSNSQNPVCKILISKAERDIKKKNEKRYPGSYSLQKTLLTANLNSYAYLCKQPATDVNIRILSKRLKRYYPSFSLIKTLFDADKKAYRELSGQ